jgi:RNA polymerase sigma factor (sigma-70 family)
MSHVTALPRQEAPPIAEETGSTFESEFRAVFAARLPELVRYLDRLSGDPALASDIAQETFVRLFERGALPADVRAWLATVANNLFRDERRRVARRQLLLARRSPEHTLGDPPPAPDVALLDEEGRAAVRAALDCVPERDRRLLLLRHEGYSYRELATTFDIVETSVGSRLARARAAFSRALDGRADASD